MIYNLCIVYVMYKTMWFDFFSVIKLIRYGIPFKFLYSKSITELYVKKNESIV